MCRLFGLHAGTDVCTATFWLLDAPDSLSEQSRRNPDGTGLGVFDAARPTAAAQGADRGVADAEFATEAHQMTGTTFIAHVRYATTGSLDIRNTHPFLQDGRIFAHNGVLEGLDVLDERLREVGADRPGAGPNRLRAGVRVDHRLDPRPRRRRLRRAGRRHALAGGQRADLCGQRAAEHGHRHVGAALPGNPRAVPAGPARRRCIRSRIRLAHQANSRAVGASVHAAVGGVRHRADGRRPALASAGTGRTGARRRRRCRSTGAWCCPTRPGICCVARN